MATSEFLQSGHAENVVSVANLPIQKKVKIPLLGLFSQDVSCALFGVTNLHSTFSLSSLKTTLAQGLTFHVSKIR